MSKPNFDTTIVESLDNDSNLNLSISFTGCRPDRSQSGHTGNHPQQEQYQCPHLASPFYRNRDGIAAYFIGNLCRLLN